MADYVSQRSKNGNRLISMKICSTVWVEQSWPPMISASRKPKNDCAKRVLLVRPTPWKYTVRLGRRYVRPSKTSVEPCPKTLHQNLLSSHYWMQSIVSGRNCMLQLKRMILRLVHLIMIPYGSETC